MLMGAALAFPVLVNRWGDFAPILRMKLPQLFLIELLRFTGPNETLHHARQVFGLHGVFPGLLGLLSLFGKLLLLSVLSMVERHREINVSGLQHLPHCRQPTPHKTADPPRTRSARCATAA